MPGVGVSISAELTIDDQALGRALSATDGDVAKALLKILAKAENGAKRRAPVDTGRLRASITSRVEQESPEQLVGILGTNVEYAIFQEFGTEHQEAKAFLRGGMEEALRSLGYSVTFTTTFDGGTGV